MMMETPLLLLLLLCAGTARMVAQRRRRRRHIGGGGGVGILSKCLLLLLFLRRNSSSPCVLLLLFTRQALQHGRRRWHKRRDTQMRRCGCGRRCHLPFSLCLVSFCIYICISSFSSSHRQTDRRESMRGKGKDGVERREVVVLVERWLRSASAESTLSKMQRRQAELTCPPRRASKRARPTRREAHSDCVSSEEQAPGKLKPKLGFRGFCRNPQLRFSALVCR